MNIRLLIDSIMQQTTVLIGQLSTAAGVRAPLAKVADQVEEPDTESFTGDTE